MKETEIKEQLSQAKKTIDLLQEELNETQQGLMLLTLELEQRVDERTAQLIAANQELEAFSYSVSHDLRAPLRAIDGFSQAILEDYAPELDEQGKAYLERICSGVQRMSQLIDDMLSLSKVTRSEMHYEEVDLSEMAKSILNDLCQNAARENLKITIAKKLLARGDKVLLRSVLENLLGNAWKFTAKKANPSIELGRGKNNEADLFFIRDNGAGFDMKYKDKLFAPFQRLHTLQEFEGTGIGLASVYRIIARHGGEIWAKSTPGKGATFYFRLGSGDRRKRER